MDSVKGVLIVAVVLGHSLLAEPLIPGFKATVYSFHVQCFLLLPFLCRAPALTLTNIGDLLVRTLVPYACAVVFFSMLNALTRDTGPWTWILDVLRALATANTNDLKKATGFYLFWFLPVLSVTLVLRTVYFHPGRLLRVVLAVSAIAAHLLLPAMPWPWKRDWALFGTHIALFIFPLGLCVHYGARPLLTRLSRNGRFLLPLSFVASSWLLLRRGLEVNLANLGYASYHHLSALLHEDLVAILALLSLLAFSRELARIPYLSRIGSKSLCVYLLHQFFVVGTLRALGGWTANETSPLYGWLAGSLSVLCGVVGPLLVAKFIYSRVRLRSILLPRSAHDLLHGFGVSAQPRISGTIHA